MQDRTSHVVAVLAWFFVSAVIGGLFYKYPPDAKHFMLGMFIWVIMTLLVLWFVAHERIPGPNEPHDFEPQMYDSIHCAALTTAGRCGRSATTHDTLWGR